MPRRKEDILDRLVDKFSFRGFMLHQATLFVAATTLVIGGVIFLWNHNRASIVDVDQYQLTAEKIDLPDAPPWVDLDPKHLILSGDTTASILNPALVEDTVQQIRQMRFVDQLKSVSKSKAGLKIDVEYRVPVAVVEINQRTMRGPTTDDGTGNPRELKLPIDRSGIIMPAQLASLPNLPIISLPDPVDRAANLQLWGDWPDQRVRDAALIGKLFAFRPEMGVFRIVTFQEPGDDSQPQPFELWGRSGQFGMRIIWGMEADRRHGKEATPAQKLAAIKALIRRVGPLAPVTGQRNQLGRVFDVRSGRAIELPREKVAQMKKLNF